MKQLKIQTNATAFVTLDGLDINEVVREAADLAHAVLEELSIWRQRTDSATYFDCEGLACKFLDMIDD